MTDSKIPIILIGPMGSGKSTVAEHLAGRLNIDFVDTDALFVQRYGVISHYFATHGETKFRDGEQAVIADAVVKDNPSIVSLGEIGRASCRERLSRSIQGGGVW